MKKQLLLLLFISVSFCSYAQFYCDFFESKSFYNKQPLLKKAGYTKEVIIVKQLKNKEMEDSFKIIINNYNQNGSPINKLIGSKWHTPVLTDTFEYEGNKQQVTAIKDGDLDESNNNTRNIYYAEGTVRYVYDSVSRVKKMLYTKKNSTEKLVRLIFYTEDGRIDKVDYAPESEKVKQSEYVYKNNKLKIFTVGSSSRECNEEMKFNEEGHIISRMILYSSFNSWTTNKYKFEYNADGLVETEIKKKDGDLYTVATHYYYKN